MSQKIYVVILLMVVATQLSRLGGLVVSKRFHISGSFEEWLKYIPVAVLTSLIIPELIHKTPEGIIINWIYVASGAVALVVGLKFRNLLLTTFSGVMTLVIIRLLTKI